MILSVVKEAGKKVVDYTEHETDDISARDWLSRLWTNPFPHLKAYFLSLFPIFTWIHRYNLGWLSGDLIAGMTVGLVVVPQSMSYSQIASLPPEYGLYTSFVGAALYCIFATSKDVSIAPVAVMSLIVADAIKVLQEEHPGVWDNTTIATMASLASGFIVLGIGLLRIGWIVDLVPMPAISGFMTGSALTIVTTQIPGLLGLTGFDSRATPYKVILNSFKHLPEAKLDAAWGLSSLFALYAIRWSSVWATKRWPRRARWFFFNNVLRNAVVILIWTITAWLYCRKRRDTKGNYPIKILKEIPAGLKSMGPPRIDGELISALAPELPVITIVSFLEHIAIAKAFGRLNGYKINPNQELIAVGVANTVGSCFGAFPATGSFSLSALQHKSGVRSPLSGVFTSIIVISALYGLTKAFYWIPSAALCSIIIHCVADLVASPSEVYKYWRFSPPEFFIWFTTVMVTVFMSIEYGIYFSLIASLLLLLVRLAHPRGSFLGKVALVSQNGQEREVREVFVPLKDDGVTNPHIKVMAPPPGVVIYRFEESFLYPNCSIFNSALVDHVKESTRRGKDLTMVHLRDRPWNDGGPRHNSGLHQDMNSKKPWLHAIILDFSAVSALDTTAIQALVDTRAEIERWTDYPVEFHFSNILSPWIRRALVAGGFGCGTSHSRVLPGLGAVVSYDDISSHSDEKLNESQSDIENGEIKMVMRHQEIPVELRGWKPLLPIETVFFHHDLPTAVRAAESGMDRVANLARGE